MTSSKLNPYVDNGRLVGRLLSKVGIWIELAGIAVQNVGAYFQWTDRIGRRESTPESYR